MLRARGRHGCCGCSAAAAWRVQFRDDVALGDDGHGRGVQEQDHGDRGDDKARRRRQAGRTTAAELVPAHNERVEEPVAVAAVRARGTVPRAVRGDRGERGHRHHRAAGRVQRALQVRRAFRERHQPECPEHRHGHGHGRQCGHVLVRPAHVRHAGHVRHLPGRRVIRAGLVHQPPTAGHRERHGHDDREQRALVRRPEAVVHRRFALDTAAADRHARHRTRQPHGRRRVRRHEHQRERVRRPVDEHRTRRHRPHLRSAQTVTVLIIGITSIILLLLLP